MWLGPMREKRAAAEKEEQRAADLKKVKHDSAQPKLLSTLHLKTSRFMTLGKVVAEGILS